MTDLCICGRCLDNGLCDGCHQERCTCNPLEFDGAQVLDSIDAFLRRYVAFPDEHCSIAVTLFAAHTHVVESFYVTPRLILDSAEPESGKTRVLELLALICRNPKMTINTTVAALYRRLNDGMLTVLFDEADAYWNPKAGPEAEQLRAFVNSGYKRGATVDRCVGDGSRMTVVEFPVFAPVAIAGLAGNMPATVTTRGITIHMRRRAPGEEVDGYEEEDVEPLATPLRENLAAWTTKVADELRHARPKMPPGVADRKAEVWRALLAIADAAGGDWPDRARDACIHFVFGGESAAPSLGVRLLTDLKAIYGDRDRMTTVELLAALVAMEEAPWGDLRGRALDARGLSRLLDRYHVKSATFNLLDGTGKTAKGYTTYPTKENDGLADAWARWLPAAEDGNDGNPGNPAGQRDYRSDEVTDPSVTSPEPVTGLTSTNTAVTEVTDPAKDANVGTVGNVDPPGRDSGMLPLPPNSSNGAAPSGDRNPGTLGGIDPPQPVRTLPIREPQPRPGGLAPSQYGSQP